MTPRPIIHPDNVTFGATDDGDFVRTTNLGMILFEDIGMVAEDGGEEILYILVQNYYRGELPHLVDLQNRLQIHSDTEGNLVDIPITRMECLRLASMFLSVALHHNAWSMEDSSG